MNTALASLLQESDLLAKCDLLYPANGSDSKQPVVPYVDKFPLSPPIDLHTQCTALHYRATSPVASGRGSGPGVCRQFTSESFDPRTPSTNATGSPGAFVGVRGLCRADECALTPTNSLGRDTLNPNLARILAQMISACSWRRCGMIPVVTKPSLTLYNG